MHRYPGSQGNRQLDVTFPVTKLWSQDFAMGAEPLNPKPCEAASVLGARAYYKLLTQETLSP